MTTPDPMRTGAEKIDRARSHGAESLFMYDSAQKAIEDTRALIDEMACVLGQRLEERE